MMYYIYTYNSRILKIVPDTYMYEPASVSGVRWFRYHENPPFVGKSPDFTRTFTFLGHYGISSIPLTSIEEDKLIEKFSKLEVTEKLNRLQMTYKQFALRDIFTDFISIFLLWRDLGISKENRNVKEGSLLYEWLIQNPELNITSLEESFNLKLDDLSQVYGYLLKQKKKIQDLIVEDQLDAALFLIDEEFRKMNL